jgi:hypothetical protein
MAKEGHKARRVKLVTRAKALKLLKAGADPQQFEKHPNFHVRARVFRLLGSNYPTDPVACAKLCSELHIKDPNAVPELPETEASVFEAPTEAL